MERLDVIDINGQVVKANDFFIPWNSNALSDPRANLIIQAGRAHLNLTNKKYDVIISEPYRGRISDYNLYRGRISDYNLSLSSNSYPPVLTIISPFVTAELTAG